MTARPIVALVAAAVLGLAACGQSDPQASASAQVLSADVSRVRMAATQGSPAALLQAADAMRAHVDAQKLSGELSGARAAAILDQLARVLADAAVRPALVAPVTPSPKPASTMKPTPRVEPDKDEAKDDDKGDGGKGKGKDD